MAITAPDRIGTVTLTIDGREVTAIEGSTIWAAAKAAGIDIPVLCHDERYDPVGVCRMCVVDVGAPAFAASCVRACESGMQVKTATPEIERSRAVLTEMLLADQPDREHDPKQSTTADNELLALADRFGVTQATTPCPAPMAGAPTPPARSSRWTTTRASCATGACAPATTSRATTSSGAAARATPPGSRST